MPLLEAFNPGDKEIFHAVFVGGANMPARIRVFVDYLVENGRGRRQSRQAARAVKPAAVARLRGGLAVIEDHLIRD
ncbi:hypothetical protein IP86_24965 [Rhodopseudomonas sp. AAP120]|nr:hypothetical protein IP86_24965 [Rhodopseudomonas sp. AAP120]